MPLPEELLQVTAADYGSELTKPLWEQLRGPFGIVGVGED